VVYKINTESDYIPDPEESLIVPVDEKLRVSRLLTSKFFRWIYSLSLLFFILSLALIFNLGFLKGDYYFKQSFGNEYTTFPIQPSRGTIYDRNLNIVADNITNYDLIIFRHVNPDHLKELSQILNRDFYKLNLLIEENKSQTVLIENISKKQADEIKERAYPGTSGIYTKERSTRYYTNGPIFSHIIGYASEVNENEIKDEFYEIKDSIGKNGLELFYENDLRGKRGYLQISKVNNTEPKIENPNKGRDIILTIDSELQKVLFENIQKGLKIAGSKKGVGVVQNINNGEILALVSLPTFDNNSFIEGISEREYSSLINDKSKPLLNRAISGRFSPGSTIKPLFALAALEEDIIDPNKIVHTKGSISVINPYDPSVVYTFRDWKNHGSVNMLQAIANSVDVYFYILGGGYEDFEGLGIDRMSSYLNDFKAGDILGIDLPGEITGLVPSRELKEKSKGESWYIGDSYNVSIGQGDLLVTPLWINAYISAIANGGKIYKPFVVNRIIDEKGDYVKIFNGEIMKELSFNENNFELVKKGMRMAVTQGTIKRYLNDLPVSVGAKTGTAEVIKGKTTNSFVTLFAPYDNPEISMTILIEDAQEALSIAPFVARDVLNWYFSKPLSGGKVPGNNLEDQFISE